LAFELWHLVKLTRGCYSDPPIFALFVPSIFRIFLDPLVSTVDKIIATSFVTLAIVICILQVIIANKNSEIRRLRKITGSLPITMTAKRLTKHSKKQTEDGQKGEGIGDDYK